MKGMIIIMNKNILDILFASLEDQDIWFTTKNDPTYAEAPSYFKLDEYGIPTKEAQKQICKEIENNIGDGAVDEIDAVELWINENLNNFKLAFRDNLVTKFKDKPVIDNIDAYEVKLESKNNDINNVDYWLKYAEDKMNNNTYIDKLYFEIIDATHNTDLAREVINKLGERHITKKEENEFANEDLLNNFTQYVANNAQEIKNGLFEIEVPKELGYDKILNQDMLRKAYIKVKKLFNLDNGNTSIIFENKNTIKTENVKTRLKEENTKSASVISSMFSNNEFDADSKDGKIIIKTSNLFNTLSDKGYNVQVSFDNGESQSSILLGDQGGQIIITINNPDQPLKAFASGNFEITTETLNIMEDILNNIKNLK